MKNILSIIPTLLTLIRIILIPFIAWGLQVNMWGISMVLFLAAALTDFLDGWLARYLCCESNFGAMFDPVADKLLILSTLYGMSLVTPLVPLWLVLLLLIKEIFFVGAFVGIWLLGCYAYEARPLIFGKLAMGVQVFFITGIFIMHIFGVCNFFITNIAIVMVCITALLAFVAYGYRMILFLQKECIIRRF